MRQGISFEDILVAMLGGVGRGRNVPKGKGPILEMTEVANGHYVSAIEQAAQQGRNQTIMPDNYKIVLR